MLHKKIKFVLVRKKFCRMSLMQNVTLVSFALYKKYIVAGGMHVVLPFLGDQKV